MALEILSDNSVWTTSAPRISFSNNLSQADLFDVDHREDSSLLESPSNGFHFCIPQENYSSSADQLFSDGKILPLAPFCAPPLQFLPPRSRPESFKETQERSMKPAQAPASSKTFWGFSRSRSLNFGSITKSAFMCSLNRLRRCQSVGSNTKAATSKKAAPLPTSANAIKKPMSKKGYNNGVNIRPVLNVPTPYISRGKSSLFGFDFFFCRKEKRY